MTPSELIDSCTEMSRCTLRSVSPESRTVVIADLNGVLIPLKDVSAEHVVTGKVQRILRRVPILGNIEVA